MTVPQILRTYGNYFTQIRKRYSNGHNGRCAVGVIMSYYGWKGIVDHNKPGNLLTIISRLERTGISRADD
jgi:hypothetical protein